MISTATDLEDLLTMIQSALMFMETRSNRSVDCTDILGKNLSQKESKKKKECFNESFGWNNEFEKCINVADLAKEQSD